MIELIDGKYTALLVVNAKQRYVTVLMLSNEKDIQKFTASITTKGEKHITKD